NPAAQGYLQGVPMGGTLSSAPGVAPRLLLIAQRDPASAAIDEVQVIKGWQTEDGVEEAVTTVFLAGDTNGASVICQQWVDPDFDGTKPAFYYMRALETPTPRWTTFDCDALAVDCAVPELVPDAAKQCCELPRNIRERAWTSPIWYQP
ncbi:MAG: DUF3604 domain-containing protein, partial [Pseudomonadota bacterium]